MAHQLNVVVERRFAEWTLHVQRNGGGFRIGIDGAVVVALQWYHVLGYVGRGAFRRSGVLSYYRRGGYL